MAMTMGGGDDVSIRIGMETDDAERKLKGFKASAESATDTAISGSRDATTEIENLSAAEREAGNAAQDAGEKAAEAKHQQADATREAERAARSSERAEHDAAAATQVRRMQQGEAAKELTEGLAQAIETFKNTGDAGEAAFQFLEKAAMGLTALNPMAGVAASIGVFFGKAAYEALGFADAAKEAAENTEKAKAEAETLAQNWTKAWTQAHTTVSEMTSGTAIAESLSKVEKQLGSIGSAAAFVEGEMAKQPPHIREAYAEQLKAIKAEETRLQILQYALQTRQGDIDIQSRGYELWKAEQDAMTAIATAREEARGTAIDQLETEKDFNDYIEERVKLIKEEIREGENSQDKKAKWVDEIGQAERKLQDTRKKNLDEMKQKEKEQHDARLQQIREQEAAEMAAMQRRLQAEIELQQAIIKAKDDAEKAQAARLLGTEGAQALAKEAEARKNDRRLILKQIQDEAEEDARKSKQVELGLSDKEAKSNVQVRRAGDAARRQAARDYTDFERERGAFDTSIDVKKNATDEQRDAAERQEEAARQKREEFSNTIGRAQNRIQDEFLTGVRDAFGQANKNNGTVVEQTNRLIDVVGQMMNANMAQSNALGMTDSRVGQLESMVKAILQAGNANEENARRRRNGR